MCQMLPALQPSKSSLFDCLGIVDALRRYGRLALYFALLILPGGFIALPLVWWLSQRKQAQMVPRGSA